MVLKGEDLQEAEKLVQRAMNQDPARRSIYLDTLAYVYLYQGRFLEAITAVGKAQANLQPDSDILKDHLATTRDRINRAAQSGMIPSPPEPSQVFPSNGEK